MYFKEIRPDAFGVLRGNVSFHEDRINLVEAPNEAGKSSLVRALDALLYGLSDEPVHGENENAPTERSVFRPWSGAEFAVSGTLVTDGTEFRVSRNLGEGRLEIEHGSSETDGTGDVPDDPEEESPGRKWTGLSRAAFRKSVLVDQDDIPLEEARNDLVQAIQKMADTAGGQTTARRALDVIERAKEQFPGRFLTDRGSLDEERERVNDRLEQMTREMERLERRRSRAEEKISRARELKREIEEIEEDLDRIDLLESMARKREYEDLLEQHRRQKEKLDELIEQKEELEVYEGFPHGQHEHVLRAHEQRNQLSTEIEELDEKEDDLQSSRDEIDRKLEEMESALGLEPGEAGELLEFCEQALYYRSEIEEMRREKEEERNKLDEPDHSLETFERLRTTFDDLDAEDRELLSELSPRLRNLSNREAKAEREISEARERVQKIDRERSSIKLRSTIVSSCGGVFLVSGVSLLFWLDALPDAVPYAVTGTGIALGVYGLLRLLRADHHRSDERSEWKVKLEQRSDDQSTQVKIRKRLQKRATALAGSLGLDGIDDLLDRYETYRNLYETLEPLLQIDARIQRLQTKLFNLIQRYESLIDRCDRELTPESPTDELQALKEDLNRYREQLKKKASIETELADLRSRRTTLKRKRSGRESTLRSILGRAGIDLDGTTIDEGVEVFKERHEKYIRLQSLREKIPEIKKSTLSPRELEETRRMYRQLRDNLERVREKRPDLEVPDDLSNPETYGQERTSLDQKKRSLIAERADLEREVGALDTRYRRRYPELEDEREELRRYRKRLNRLSSSIELAAEVLESVSEEVHAEWARTLNRNASRIIGEVAPKYSGVRFDTDLSFTIEADDHTTTLSPEQVRTSLSQGVREQIYLAVRLGLAQYLSDRNEPLPIILDEPFAHVDDERFERFFQMLAEQFLPDHQVIVLTCHGSRVDWLRERNPDWFEQRIRAVELPSGDVPAETEEALETS